MSTDQKEQDDLKALWQGLHHDPARHPLDEASIRHMLQQRMQGPLSSIQRTVRIEMWITYITTGILLVLPFINPAKYVNWTYALITLIMLGLSYVYYRSNRKLHQFNYAQTNAKEAMQVLVAKIEGLVRKYYIISQFTIAPSALIGMVYGMQTAAAEDGRSLADVLEKPIIWVICGVALAAISVAGYFFIKWYFHMLYGRYVAQLRRNLNELDETY